MRLFNKIIPSTKLFVKLPIKLSLLYIPFSLLLATGSIQSAQADSPFFFGVDVGIMSVKDDKKSPTNATIVVGYAVNNGVGFEVQYSSSLSDGELITNKGAANEKTIDFDVKTFGAYAAYRYEFWQGFYAKAKAGVLREEINGIGETGGSYGLGVGYKFEYGIVEFEVSRIQRDINYMSLGYRYSL